MKKKFFAVALATTMVASSAIPVMADTASADTETGLIGYYTFDDTLKNAAGEGSAKLHGGAGDTWNQDAKGSATYVEGKNGKGYVFTGDVDGIRGEGLELDAKTSSSDFTISAWIKAENFGVGTSSMMFATNTVNSENDACFSVNTLNGYNGSVLLGKIWDWENRNDTFVCLDGDNTGEVFTTDKWVYITITGKSGEQKLYLNGILKDSSTSINPLVVDNLKGASIFLGINWWDDSFAGIMDDVAVYDRALSADDVAALYEKNGVPVKEDEPSTGEDPTEPVNPSPKPTEPVNPSPKPTEPVNPSPKPTEPANPSPKPTEPENPTTSSSITDVNDFDVTSADAEKVNKEAVVTGLPENVTLRVASIEKSSADYNAIVEFVNKELKDKKVAAADLSLVKDGVAYAEQPNGKVKVTLPLFENIKDAKWVQVYRYDNTTKTFITVDKAVEVKDGKFTFETDHFTPYLFASVNAPEEETTTAAETTTGKTVTDTGNKPQTGDSAPIAVFAGLAAAGLAVFAVSKKRKNA